MIARTPRFYIFCGVAAVFFFALLLHPTSRHSAAVLPSKVQGWLSSGGTDGNATVGRHIDNFDPVKGIFDVAKVVPQDPAGPKPSEIIVLTASDGQGHNNGIDNILQMAEENRRDYCEARGYNYHFVNISAFHMDGGIEAVWKKLPAINQAFNEYPHAKWLWWLDLDAIIMTPQYKIEELLLSKKAMEEKILKHEEYGSNGGTKLGVYSPDEVDWRKMNLLVAQDGNGINAGSFFLRRSRWTQLLLDLWRDQLFMKNEDWPGREQDALVNLVSRHPSILEHTGLMPLRAINSYVLDDVPFMGWAKGDLVVHLAGCWVEGHCAENWNRMWERRTKVSDLTKEQLDGGVPELQAKKADGKGKQKRLADSLRQESNTHLRRPVQ